MSKRTKPTSTAPDDRVAIVAGTRTQGAAPGATASPLRKDLDAWLALGWQRVEPKPEPEPVSEPDAE